MSTAHMPNVQRQKMGQPYWQASDASSHTLSKAPSRKYYDYFADKYSPEGALVCQQARDAQKSQLRRNPRQRSSLISPRAAFAVQSAAHGYADTFRKQPSHAQPVLESPASSHLDSARQSHYSAHSFDYYRTAGMHNKMPSLSTTRAAYASSLHRKGATSHSSTSSSTSRISLPEAPVKRPGLECTVCGPGASGPWKRGPIGQYTLCSSCAKINWQEEDGSLPLNIHEALSLLDNMRLARLASVTRNMTDKSQEDLARRLQLGLPDSTYTRVQEYLARQEQIPRQAARSTISNSTAKTVSSYNFQDARHHPPSDPSNSKAANGLKRRSRDLDFDEPTEPAKRCALEKRLEGRSDFGRRLSAQADKNYLSVKAEAEGLSPQSIAVAALMAQRGSSQPTTESSRAPLTPTRAEGTSSNNREQVDSHSPAKDSAGIESVLDTGVTGWQSMPEVTELCAARFKSSDKSPMDTAASDRSALSAAKPFPFRQEDCLKAKPLPRIIDRRRARNEDMRRQYMQKRLEQQRAREAKVGPRSQSRESEPSKSAPMLDGHDAPRLATSDQASSSPSSVCNAPPSMRNLLNSLPKSS